MMGIIYVATTHKKILFLDIQDWAEVFLFRLLQHRFYLIHYWYAHVTAETNDSVDKRASSSMMMMTHLIDHIELPRGGDT